jgi:hypothetical protein
MNFQIQKLFPTLILFGCLVFLPQQAFASVGVGVGIGKIHVDESLKAGQVYKLVTLPVSNTGDTRLEYELTVEFHEGVKELWPERDWFNFSPKTFWLEPGEVKPVEVIVTIPVNVKPGDYFAYLEAHPLKKDDGSGVTQVGIAAASKLYFSANASSIWVAVYYRILTIMDLYKPTSYIILGIVLFVIAVIIFRKYFSFNVSLSAKGKKKVKKK